MCDNTVIEVGSKNCKSSEVMLVVFLMATGCLFSNLAGKNYGYVP